MNRRIAAFVCTALTLGTVTAGYAGHKWLSDSDSFKDGYGHVWHVVGHFRGQVKQYDVENHYLGSFGTDNSDKAGSVTAEVTIDKRQYALHGPGRHALRDAKGVLVGYAELAPETTAQRAEGQKAYLKRMGYDEILPFSHGSGDGDGGSNGYFGDRHEITFQVIGQGEARFTRTDNGHVVMRGRPGGTRDVSSGHPIQFIWTVNGVTRSVYGYRNAAAQLTLPQNIPVRVDLIPATK